MFVYNMASEHDACSSSSVMNPHKIPVFLVNGKPKIWNAKDAVMLREHHRVVGVLVGCLPRHPRQNLHLGLPLQLLPEELTLLLDKGVVRLVKEKTTTSQEYLRRAEVVEEERKASFESQQELFQEERRREMLRNKERILEGQREKRQRLMMTQSQNTPPTLETDPDEEQLHLDRIQFPATAEKHLLVQLFSENPWQQETESAEDDWAFPHTYLEKVRCLVFRDLWEKGHFLTSGQKFGGDFLAYPGDPSRFHSFYIVMCVEQDRQLPALDLVAMGRLGATVRKTVLIASLDSESSVQYTSLQWTWMS